MLSAQKNKDEFLDGTAEGSSCARSELRATKRLRAFSHVTTRNQRSGRTSIGRIRKFRESTATGPFCLWPRQSLRAVRARISAGSVGGAGSRPRMPLLRRRIRPRSAIGFPGREVKRGDRKLA